MVLLGLIESPPENRALSGAVVTVRTWPDRPLAHHASASQPSRRAAWRHETPLSQQLVPTPTRPVPARAGGSAGLLSVLKGLEIQKTLGAEPVLAALRRFPAQPARYRGLPGRPPSASCARCSQARGVRAASTRTSARPTTRRAAGKNTVVVTPTASGKTLCYNLPVLDTHPEGPGRARPLPLSRPRRWPRTSWPSCYGADRGAGRRHRHLHLRRRHAAGRAQGHPRARPHRGHQPGHAAHGHPAAPHQVGEAVREPALRRRRRAAQLPRRLRLARGQRLPPAAPALPRSTAPTRSSSARSATIGNPQELAEALTGREMTLIDESGAPRGERYFAIYNPPVVNRQLGHPRARALGCARDVALSFLEQGPADDRLRARRAWPPRCWSRT